MPTHIEVITGPTASGKSETAIRRAKDDPSIEIVNADAFQLYRGFDIGTAKPSRDIREKIPHHLIDIVEPNVRYTAAEYSRVGRAAIREIVANRKMPIVVGGTGLYIDALFYGLSGIDISDDTLEEARTRYKKELEIRGFEAMFDGLRSFDPVLYTQIEREQNPIRLKRAYEHYYATGVPLGIARAEKPEPFEFAPMFTVIDIPRVEIHRRIEQRIDEMLAMGWVQEVEGLLQSGVTIDMPAMRAIGYKDLTDVIAGKTSISDARNTIVIRTRQYAKRQTTWMKRYSEK